MLATIKDLISQPTDSIPVNLAWIEDFYEVHYVNLSPACWGFGSFEDGLLVIGVNRNLHRYQQRMVLAHEVGHHVRRHVPPDPSDPVFKCRSNVPWWHLRQELQAQQFASNLLLPQFQLLDDLLSGMSVHELEDRYEVPAILIEIRTDLREVCRRSTTWLRQKWHRRSSRPDGVYVLSSPSLPLGS
ncbi:MAG: ImmA/IrrE family metallo-endopeptidase [Chloroflexota bacterium]